MFNFVKKFLSCLPNCLCQFIFPIVVNHCSCYSMPSTIIIFLDFVYFHRHVVVSYCFHLEFPNDIQYSTSFYILICHLYMCVRHSLSSLLLFKVKLFIFFSLNFKSFGQFWLKKSLNRYIFYKYFFSVRIIFSFN